LEAHKDNSKAKRRSAVGGEIRKGRGNMEKRPKKEGDTINTQTREKNMFNSSTWCHCSYFSSLYGRHLDVQI
jgi:hypothetical protein